MAFKRFVLRYKRRGARRWVTKRYWSRFGKMKSMRALRNRGFQVRG